jgi:hypothetical protein
VDDSGVAVCQSGNGILLQEYPTFTLDVRNEERQKLGQHGIWDFFSFYGKRDITFTGVILGSSHLNLVQWQEKILEVLTLPSQPIAGTNDGYITITWTDALGKSWQVSAKIQQDVTFSRDIGNKLRSSFFINLKSESSFILSQTAKTDSGLHGWTQNSLFLPAFLPAYFHTTYPNLISIYQDGTSDAPATYRLNGPITTPKITQLKETFTNDTVLDSFSTGWTGGTSDTTHFQTAGVSQKLTSTGSQDTMTKTVTLDLTGAKYITFYFYVDNADNFAYGSYNYTIGQNYVKFIENAGVDEYVAELSLGNNTIRNGWNYFSLLRDQFEIIGSPTWDDITSIEFSIKSKTGSTLNVSFDDLHNRDITYSQRKLEITGTIAASDYVEFDVLEGTIVNSSGTDLSSNLTATSEWFFLYPKQNLLLMESSLTPTTTGILPYVYNDPVSETGLIGYWHFDEDAFTDYLSSNNGVATGAVNIVDSSVHGSLKQIELDGVSYMSATCPYNDFSVTAATVSMWIEFDDFSADHVIFSRLFGDATYPYLEYDQSADKLILHYEIDSVAKSLDLVTTVSSSFSTRTPYNLTLKFDVSTGVSSWFNLTTTASDSETGVSYSAATNTMKFGANAGDTVYHRGRLDEIRLYNVLLTDAQRTQLFYTPEQNKLLQQAQITWNDAML